MCSFPSISVGDRSLSSAWYPIWDLFIPLTLKCGWPRHPPSVTGSHVRLLNRSSLVLLKGLCRIGLEILFQTRLPSLSSLLVCFSVQCSFSLLRDSVTFLPLLLLSASVNAHSYIKFNILQNSLKVLNLPAAANSSPPTPPHTMLLCHHRRQMQGLTDLEGPADTCRSPYMAPALS